MTAARGRGWLFVALGAAIILLVFLVGMPIYELFAEQGDETAQLQSDLAHDRAEIAARPALERARAALAKDGAMSAALLQGASSALASANLQGLVKSLVERHGGQLRSADTVATQTSGGLEKISVQFELALPPGTLLAATYDLESGTPYLYLDAAEIRPELYAGPAESAPSSLHVSWTVHGYRAVR